MPSLNLFNSFRVRLLLVLALLLIATLGVQFYLNRRAEQRVARRITDQEQALATAFSLAVQSFSTTARLKDLDKDIHFLQREKQAGRITNVLIVRDDGDVPGGGIDPEDIIDDSLDPAYNPEQLDDGAVRYVKLSDVPLPRVVNAAQANLSQPIAGEPLAFVIPAQTDKGRYNIIIVLGSVKAASSASFWQAVRPLLPTLSVLLAATLITGLLVW